MNAQLGLDYRLSGGFHVGPFAALAIGEYEQAFSSSPSIGGSTESLPSKSLHAWLTLGIKGTFDLPRPPRKVDDEDQALFDRRH